MRWRVRLRELRTRLTAADPGLDRLQLASIATSAMVLAALITSGVQVLTGQPVTVVIFSAALAMISNLSVNEPDLGRQRLTALLMLAPAMASVAAGAVLVPWRIAADAVFVVVMMVAVYVRRFGPRGFALGQAAFIPFFFTQFLRVDPAQLPWLLVSVAIGIGSTLLLRGWVFAERPERALERLVRAFRAHLHTLVDAVADLLAAAADPARAVDAELRDVHRRRVRLNETALLVADRLEQLRGDPENAADDNLALRILDTELAAERLAVATRRLVEADTRPDEQSRRALVEGMRGLAAASATGTSSSMVPTLLAGVRHSVGELVAGTEGQGDRTQRVAFAVGRLADALASNEAPDPSRARSEGEAELGRDGRPDEAPDPRRDGRPTATDRGPDTTTDDTPGPGIRPTTRQSIQVGVATSLVVVVGELVSPARWYWAVIAAFVVFAGTNSRGDILTRGSQSVIGTIGGVVAGVGLAAVVGDRHLLALALMFGCVFLALYLVRISQTLLAFWITAVLALLYGLIGQLSVETLVLRLEETVVGAAMGMLAGYLVLPRRTREVFAEAVDDLVDATDEVLAAAVDQVVGRAPDKSPVPLARDMDEALATLRQRVKPLESPLPRRRGRSSYHRTLRVLTRVDHHARSLARLSDRAHDPGWSPTLQPAAERVRANLDGVRLLILRREGAEVSSAEDLVDTAEAYAAPIDDPRLRTDLLGAARLLRRIDQTVVGFGADLAPRDADEARHPAARPAGR